MTYDWLKSILVLVAFLGAATIFGLRVYRLLWVNMRRGQPSGPFNQWGERLKSLFVFVGAQFRLFRYLWPGTSHFFIFWGFLILSLTILQAIMEGLLSFRDPNFSLPIIGSFGPLAFLQDVMAVFVMVAILYGLFTRQIVDPERYKGSHKSQGVMVLWFIFTIMITLLVINAIRINLGEDQIANWRPISRVIGVLFSGLNEDTQVFIEEIAYWVHLGVVLIFLTELPGGKHFHVVTSIPAVFLRNLEPVGRLPLAPEVDGEVGVSAVEQFQWRQMLDFYTCTECGRCQDVCPAYNSGLTLSPKLLMMSLRDNLMARGEILSSGHQNGNDASIIDKPLVGDVITEDILWACTTCYACDQECPLFIEHVTPIVDMRRHLIIEGRVDTELQDALANLGRYGNSFGKSERMRARWTKGVKPKIKDARKEPVEYLWFLGDYASYHASLKEISRQTLAVFKSAELDFGILYEGERNSGNDVRRVGEEGLYEMLQEHNVDALEKSDYQTIITTDPHAYNTLKNEYPANGRKPVLHYTELLDQVIASGRLKFQKNLGYQVTYHDPCYLGRYNDVYDAPRRVIAATGCTLVEMPRCRDRTFCCGAGGGRIWMPDPPEIKTRPAEQRVLEAAALPGVSTLVVTCPKDLVMFQDAVKTTALENQLVVKDLIELVAEALDLTAVNGQTLKDEAAL
jgi:Fe-S oxidoreductase